MIKNYLKKPISVEAIQWTGENNDEITEFAKGKAIFLKDGLVIRTLEGDMEANVSDYIIKGVKGEFYPCKEEIFEETYFDNDLEKLEPQVPEYKLRFMKEYKELKERYWKLHKLLVRYDADTLDFEPDCPIELLKAQAKAMGEYLYILEMRAEIEYINLEN